MNYQRIVVTVHGIRTFGQWQKRLADLLISKNSATVVESYGYGYFSVLAFLMPPLRWLATLRFKKELVRILERNPEAQVDLVAHSFGTHLVGFALRGLAKKYRNRIGTVLLAGSVLRSDFPWSELIDTEVVRCVVNDCGVDDAILLLSQFCVLFTGMAGRVGFVGTTNDRLRNRFFRGGHSHYFEVGATPEFMERNWLPVLQSENARIQDIDERVTSGPLQGIVLTSMQLAEPIKLCFYVGIPLLLVFYLHVQPLANARAKAAYEGELRQKESERANAEAKKTEAVETARFALAEKLVAQEAASLAERERADALASLAKAEGARAEAEAAAFKLMQTVSLQRQRAARLAWTQQAKLIASLPQANRARELNASLALLDDALRFDFDRSAINNPESRETLNNLVEGIKTTAVRGPIILSGRIGKFCVVNRVDDDPKLAPDQTPISSCGTGITDAYAQKLSMRLAEAVKAYMVSIGYEKSQIYTEGLGLRNAGLPYPESGYAKSWNLVASLNNQVVIRFGE